MRVSLRLSIAVSVFSLVLSACGSGDSTRSPDLPPATGHISINCTPTTIAKGQTGSCTASCTYDRVQADGSIVTRPGACTGLKWSSANSGSVSIDQNGVYTGVEANTAPGVNVTGSIDDDSASVPIRVTDAIVTSLDIIPATQNLVVGLRSQYQAIARFSDGGQSNVAQDAGMTWSVPATQNNISICNTQGGCGTNHGKGTVTGLAVGGPITVDGSYTLNGNTVTDNAQVTVVDATLTGLCVEPVTTANPDFTGCRADGGACATTAGLSIPVGGTVQFRARGRYNNNQECSLTQTATWSSGNSSFFTVNNTSSKGLATGVAPGTSNAIASLGAVSGQHALTVLVSQVLGNNSLEVGVPVDSNVSGAIDHQDTLGKFFCVGYADLVGGLQDSSRLPGRQQLEARARFCPQSALRPDGSCDPAQFNPPTTVVATDVRRASSWVALEGFWNGSDCESIAGDPTGMNIPPAQVGDTFTTSPAVDNKGLVTPRGSVRLGTACIKATYTNPADANDSDFDGATALVLPITNDVLLQDGEVDDAVELCNTLAPLFLLGGSNGGAGAVTQLVSGLSEILNPVLTALTQGIEPDAGPIPTNDVIDQLVAGLSDNATAAIFAAGLQDVVDSVNDGVYAPLNCGLGALLLGLTTQDPALAQQALAACPPSGSGAPGLPGGGGGDPIAVGPVVIDPAGQCLSVAGQGGCLSDLPLP